MKDKTIEKRAGFTPGPWKVGNYNYIRGTIFSVAVAIDLPGQDEKEKQANARLISQAPAMYQQCKLFEKMLVELQMQGETGVDEELEDVRELLSSVEGGEG